MCKLIGAGLVGGPLLVLLVATGPAGAVAGPDSTPARAAAAHHVPVRPGSTWVFRLVSGACEIVHFHAEHTFTTAGKFSDAGNYTANDPEIAMKWTAGPDFSTSYTGTFSSSTGIYQGIWFDGDHIPATLTPGSGCR